MKVDRADALRPCDGVEVVDSLQSTPLFKQWAQRQLPKVLLRCAGEI